MNEAGNEYYISAEAVPTRRREMDLDHENTRRQLIAMRSKLGANTPAGHRCSNLVEQLDAMRNAPSKEQRGHLAKGIARQMAELAELTAKAGG